MATGSASDWLWQCMHALTRQAEKFDKSSSKIPWTFSVSLTEAKRDSGWFIVPAQADQAMGSKGPSGRSLCVVGLHGHWTGHFRTHACTALVLRRDESSYSNSKVPTPFRFNDTLKFKDRPSWRSGLFVMSKSPSTQLQAILCAPNCPNHAACHNKTVLPTYSYDQKSQKCLHRVSPYLAIERSAYLVPGIMAPVSVAIKKFHATLSNQS